MRVPIKGLFLAVLAIVGFGSFAQERNLVKGDQHYENLSYYEAIVSYESAFRKGIVDVDRMRRLAESYHHLRDMEGAALWYGKIVKTDQATSGDKIRYAEALRANGRYEDADKWLQELKSAGRPEVKRFRNSQENVAALLNDPLFKGTVRPLSSNTETGDWSPWIQGDQLIFASSRTKEVTFKPYHGYDGKAYMDLYAGTFTEGGDVPRVKPFSKKLNSPFHESNPTMTADGQKMAFTRNHLENNKLGRSEDGVSNLQIYFSKKEKNKWSEAEAFEHNKAEWSFGHPSLSPDGKKLFFVSDKPGGYGGSDIYVSTLSTDGSWSEPRNLGSRINTVGNELSPSFHADGTLFFASDGHFGVGGLDVFMSIFHDDEPGEVLNLGAPVNSRFDDLCLVLTKDGEAAYFSSNRPGGAGDDDIYRFDLSTPYDRDTFFESEQDENDVEIADEDDVFERSETIDARVIDAINGLPLEGVQLLMESQARNGVAAIKAKSDEDGHIHVELPIHLNRSNDLLLTKDGYLPRLIYIDDRDEESLNASTEMEIAITPMADGVDLAKAIGLAPVYFAFESWEILPEAAEELDRMSYIMKTYPTIVVDVNAYTDSHGSTGFNDVLSELRANATLEYLVSRGIDVSRLNARGYGESKPVNRCVDGVKCSDQEHSMNRRTEFIVTKFE